MAILSGDLKLLKSEIMSDAPESGGGCTENVIVDGVSNNMFDDISTLARTYGAVRLRKIFAKVSTQNTDRFYGSHLIISKLPKDQKLGVNLFKTGDHFDVRPDAAYRIENYRAQGAKYLGFLYGTQYKGSQTLTIFQSESVGVPITGEVLALVKSAGAIIQYVRITAISSVVQTFTDEQGSFTRRIVSIELSSPLDYDFLGAEMSRYDTMTPPSIIYKTTVANAARYYSARPLAQQAALGDFSVNVDTVYSQVVPASQSQTPLIDLSAGGKTSPVIDTATGLASFTFSTILSANVHLYIGRAFSQGSLQIDYNGGSITDSAGELMLGGVSIGTCDYAAGTVSFAANAPSIGDSKTAYFRPAVAPLVVADTDSIAITDINRSFVYTLNINPPPQPNALAVSFMALGNWYELRDNGAGGLLRQVDGIGSGSVNYVTGSVAVTLTSLPDVGSELMFSWGKKVDHTPHYGSAIALGITKQLSHDSIVPTSLVISWNDGAAKTITCNTAGVLSGDGTGNLTAATGLVVFAPTVLPPKDTVFTFNYNYGAVGSGAEKVTKSLTSFNMVGNNVDLNLGDTNIVPGSLAVEWAVPWGSSIPNTVPNGDYANLPNPASGVAQQADRDNGAGGFVGGRSASVNYSTGIVSFNWNTTINLKFALFSALKTVAGAFSLFRGYLGGTADMGTPNAFTVHYRLTGGSTSTTGSDTLTLSAITLKLATGVGEPLVTSSVYFTFAGRTYVDRLGQLYYNIDPATGAGSFGGTVDYSNAACSLTSWTAGASNSGTLTAALSTPSFDPVDRIVFRTDIAPVKPASFSIRATPLAGGGQISATASEGGGISTTDMVGSINNNTGVVKIDFGQWVTAAGKEGEPWYNAEMVVSGQIFQPKPVLASSVIYNAVSYTYIPLSADILGLDPVRLPIDGRIPVYHKGDVVVILNDQTTVGTFTSSTTTNLGRIRLAKVSVKDLGGNLLAANKYSVNLDTGVITWGDLSGVSQPLKIVDRIEDMAVLSDVQITGKLVLSKPTTHAFPVNGTLVANAVIYNDMYARASIPFDQQTWTNVWSELLIGNSTSAEFNATLYPVTVQNLSTIEERWALVFTSSITFNVIGEHVGQIVTGANINNDLAPNNPATNEPYFTLNHLGFGGGWSAGNVLRFNTYAATAPLWVIQSVAQGEPTDPDYGFCVEYRGDIDAP